ncbi:L-asparaginase, partial [Phenoliferia sp. Uapishka_3]
MRPSTALSADGPANLLQAVTLAALPSARNRGAMIVLNDRIGAAWYTEKTNGNVLDTFKAVKQGYIGGFLDNKPFFYFTPSQPLFKNTFSVANLSTAPLPRVDILISYEDFDGVLIQAAIAAGAKGLVIAGTGAGATTSLAEPHISAALLAGIPIVISSKTNGGAVEPGSSAGEEVSSGYLNPVKSRLQLQLALAHGMGLEQIRGLFEDKLGAFLQ